MSFSMRKLRGRDLYKVFNRTSRAVHADALPRRDAETQLARLNAGDATLAAPSPASALAQYAMRKVRGQDCYKVYSRRTKHVFAKCTTKEKAARQLKLLMAIRYNANFERI
jgi:UDP:flavonoid glycosyltransferase YjiC (YdhE family)